MKNLIIKSLLIVLTTFALPLGIKAQSNGFEVIRSIELMDEVYANLEKYFVDDIKTGELSKTAIDAMLKKLDPYTVYYHESNIEDYKLLTTGQYGGIGSLIRKSGDFVYIAEPYEGKPAQVSGLIAGDKILEIDGKSMEKKSSSDVSSALKGPKGTTVKVLVERPDKSKKTITIERDEIKLPDVPYTGMMTDDIGYVKLNSFTKTASANVISAYKKLEAEGMKSFILDLRGNGGGLLIEAVKIVNMFVPKNQVVVKTKGRIEDQNRVYKTMASPLSLTIPVVVLIDGRSASASEIVSGSLQDLDRGVIVGETSFGKGLVQRTYDLSYGSKMKLTIAKYYTPSGRCVQRLEYYDDKETHEVADSLITKFKTKNGREVIDGRGIEPDVDVELDEYGRLTALLVRDNLLFDFATQYKLENASITSAKDFTLTDAEYEKFKQFVLEKEFEYSTATEEMLNKMKETAETEGFYDEATEEFNALMKKVKPSKERDLEKFKTEIKEMLENEIISRYYYQNGRAEHSFKKDNYLNEAISILKNTERYHKILGK